MAKVEIRILFGGQRRCGSHYSGFLGSTKGKEISTLVVDFDLPVSR